MLFKPELLAKVLSGEKTQTRRIRKDTQTFDGFRVVNFRDVTRRPVTLWRIGQSYAACPGRGKVQQGRFTIKNIRHEDVRGISHQDVVAEGFTCVADFLRLWISMHDTRFYGQLYKRAAFLGYVSTDGLTWSMRWIEDCELEEMVMNRPDKLYDAWALTFEVA